MARGPRWQAEPGTPDHHRLEVLAMLVDAYESRRWPMECGDPVDLQARTSS